jgi:hypothetical protein
MDKDTLSIQSASICVNLWTETTYEHQQPTTNYHLSPIVVPAQAGIQAPVLTTGH